MNRARPLSRQQTIKSIAIVAARKGITVRDDGREVVVEGHGIRRAFPGPDQAAGFLLLCGVI